MSSLLSFTRDSIEMEPKYKPWDYVWTTNNDQVVLCAVEKVTHKATGTYLNPTSYVLYQLRYDRHQPTTKWQGTGSPVDISRTEDKIFPTKKALLESL